jgi:hypothetical protein
MRQIEREIAPQPKGHEMRRYVYPGHNLNLSTEQTVTGTETGEKGQHLNLRSHTLTAPPSPHIPHTHTRATHPHPVCKHG